ncbi:MAG: 3-carboxy-cis,cis-muconate cycloisomerase [Pseudomonadota bacterium]
MGVSAFDNSLLSGLFSDPDIAAEFSAEKTLDRYRDFEIALTEALTAEGIISGDAAQVIDHACRTLKPDVAAIAQATARNGVPVPDYVRQIREKIGPTHAKAFHTGTTSQDLVDTSLMLALKSVNAIFGNRLDACLAALDALSLDQGAAVIKGRTRMQFALRITAADRVATWRAPLQRDRGRLRSLAEDKAVLQFGGAVGTRHALGDKGAVIAERVAKALGLTNPPESWHSQRDRLADYASWLSLVTGSLGKIGQDMCLMAQQGIDEIALSGGGSSSAMPHKQNPVGAELLVTLARFNAVQLAGFHQSLIHEQERSGAAWMLEWMILPQMCVATGTALRTGLDLIQSIDRIGDDPENSP